MAQILDGNAIAADIRKELKQDVERIEREHQLTPGLAVVIVGNNAASRVYVNRKKKACEDVGICSFEHELAEEATEESLLKLIEQLNQDENVHGILVQLPLPKQMDEQKVLLAIDPSKDVDGFHPFNVGQMMVGAPTFLPCTPYGIQEMIRRCDIETSGQHVVVLGRSNIVGKPIAMMMVQKMEAANATVTICHSRTQNLSFYTQQADILIAALGQAQFVTADMVKEGAVVIDVGINRVDDASNERGFRLVGDVDTEAVKSKASAITPVPGGVGPMTIAMLLSNTVKALKRQF